MLRKPSKSFFPFMREQVEAYLQSLVREGASTHTVRNYRIDLEEVISFLTPPGGTCPNPSDIDLLTLREWMASLYERLTAVSIRRKLAAVRSFFKYLQRCGLLDANVAKLLRSPKLPKTLPRVISEERASNLLNQLPQKAATLGKRFPERDLAIVELLYGTGVRVSELAGLRLEDLDLSDKWIRVRGKGKKERQVPLGSKAAGALEAYLRVRHAAPQEIAVFVNSQGRALTDRSVRIIVKLYSSEVLADSSLHPHSFRHAYATHLLSSGADLRAIQELLGHAQLSTTQKYTQVSLIDLMRVYDDAHPKSGKIAPKLPDPG